MTEHFVSFPPSGSDDWPALSALLASTRAEIHFVPGATYHCATRALIPSNTRLFLHGATIECALPKSVAGEPFLFNHVFAAWPTIAGKGTLSADTPRGSLSIALRDAPITNTIRIFKAGGSTSQLGSIYAVRSREGDGIGPFAVTLDRPLAESFTVAETTVDYPSEVPRNIRINGGGAVFVGAGDGIVEFSGTTDCLVENIVSQGDFAHPKNGGVVFAMDVLGRRNIFRNVTVDQRNGGYGFSLETQEDSVLGRCFDLGGRDPAMRSFWIGSSHRCVMHDCFAGPGTVSSLDGSDNRVEGCAFVGGKNGLLVAGERNTVRATFQSVIEHSLLVASGATDTNLLDCVFLDCGKLFEPIYLYAGASGTRIIGVSASPAPRSLVKANSPWSRT